MSEQLEPVTIPKWGIEMTHGKIVVWHKSVGEPVSVGDDIVDIETDKIINSFEARVSGTLVRILADKESEHPVGHLIGIIAKEPVSADLIDAYIVSYSEDAQIPETSGGQTSPEADFHPAQKKILITPALKRKLNKAGFDITAVTGTGPSGRIMKEDVDRVLSGAIDSGNSVSSGQPLTSRQATVARKLSEAQSTLPLYHVSMDVDLDSTVARMESLDGSEKVSLNDLIVRAVQQSLVAHPQLNVMFDAERVTPIQGHSVGLAVATAEEVVAPVVQASLDEDIVVLAEQMSEVIARARNGKLTRADHIPTAITVSNLGMYGVRDFTAMVTPPQVMVLSVGAIRRTPVFNDANEVIARSIMTLTLGSDHRVINGVQAANFLGSIKSYLECSEN